MPFVPCYVLEFLKLSFLLPHVRSRWSLDICLVVLAHLNTHTQWARSWHGLVCSTRAENEDSGLSKHCYVTQVTQSSVCWALVQVSIIICLISLSLGLIKLSPACEKSWGAQSMGDKVHLGAFTDISYCFFLPAGMLNLHWNIWELCTVVGDRKAFLSKIFLLFPVCLLQVVKRGKDCGSDFQGICIRARDMLPSCYKSWKSTGKNISAGFDQLFPPFWGALLPLAAEEPCYTNQNHNRQAFPFSEQDKKQETSFLTSWQLYCQVPKWKQNKLLGPILSEHHQFSTTTSNSEFK